MAWYISSAFLSLGEGESVLGSQSLSVVADFCAEYLAMVVVGQLVTCWLHPNKIDSFGLISVAWTVPMNYPFQVRRLLVSRLAAEVVHRLRLAPEVAVTFRLPRDIGL